MNRTVRTVYIFLICLAASGCPGCHAPRDADPSPPAIRNVIILIGDGMGTSQVSLLNAYAKYAPESVYRTRDRVTAVERAMATGTLGLASCEPLDVLVADSAASGSQMASGVRTRSEIIGADGNGNPVGTLLDDALARGQATGLVTDTRITHATPASFAAHQPYRGKENEIAVEMISQNIDVMLAAGLRHFIPRASRDTLSQEHQEITERIGGAYRFWSQRNDNRNLLDDARAAGYQTVFDRKEMLAVTTGKLLGLFGNTAMQDGIRETVLRNDPDRNIPTLPDMTRTALAILDQNPRGFFLMVESGQIDWAGHNNDAGQLLHEMIRLDTTLDLILDWMKDRTDTLLIVTSDHETGGFSFSYSRYRVPTAGHLPGSLFAEEPFQPNFNFGDPAVLDKLYRQTLSFETIIGRFDRLTETEQTPARLMDMVNAAGEFKITEADAARVLEREPNQYYVENHRYIGRKTFPRIDDFEEFYVYGDNLRMDILGRIMAREQCTVWSTGSHTSNLVPVIAVGPAEVTARFSGLMHTTDWSRRVREAVNGG